MSMVTCRSFTASVAYMFPVFGTVLAIYCTQKKHFLTSHLLPKILLLLAFAFTFAFAFNFTRLKHV